MTRRSPRANVDAAEFLAWLDTYATLEDDLDGVTRRYINGVWVDDNTKRTIRRYRSKIHTIRPSTVNRLLSTFNLEDEWQARQ